MENIKFSKLNQELSLKDLQSVKFSMNVESGAEACADVVDFYRNTLITPTDVKAFNNVPGNKGTKRIPVLNTGRVTKAFNCNWSASDVDLDAKEVGVDKVSVMVEICVSDIEDSFAVNQLASGAGNFGKPALLSYIWGEVAKQAKADMEWLRWNGDKTSADSFEKLTNGYMTLLANNAGQVNVVSGATTITATNVIAELGKALASVPAKLRSKASELSIFVSSDVALAYALATAQGNHIGNVTEDMGTMFLGKYKLIEVVDLPASTMIIAPKQDMVYTYDLVEEGFTIVDMNQTAATPTMRFRINMYYGFDIYDYANVTYYGASLS